MAIETNGLKNYLSTLPQQSDVDSIMAKDANGNPIWIKKADLAQVAAELIGVFASKGVKIGADFNDLTETGIYKIQSDSINELPNRPFDAYQFGMLLVFRILKDSEDRILQIYVSHNPVVVYVRMRNSYKGNPSWKNWIKLSSTILE